MSLTVGTGPFAERRAGTFNADLAVPEALLYFDPYLPRVRALFEGETVADSTATSLLHESGRLPVFCFPPAGVRADLLEPSGRTEEMPGKGVVSYRSLSVGERTAADAAWVFEDPPPSASFLAGQLSFAWSAIDEWFTEDEQVFGHPRDPYCRVDVLKSTRHVRVSLEGECLADTRRAKILFETALPPRYYIPPEDVRTDLLVPSPTRWRCAYKGSAAYWNVRLGERLHEDLVWSFRDPQYDAKRVAAHFCFFTEHVDLELDGEPVERPRTRWS